MVWLCRYLDITVSEEYCRPTWLPVSARKKHKSLRTGSSCGVSVDTMNHESAVLRRAAAAHHLMQLDGVLYNRDPVDNLCDALELRQAFGAERDAWHARAIAGLDRCRQFTKSTCRLRVLLVPSCTR